MADIRVIGQDDLRACRVEEVESAHLEAGAPQRRIFALGKEPHL